MNVSPLVVNDAKSQQFLVHRSTMVDPEILLREQSRIFDRCWIYVGHESEIRAPGDFKTRTLCGRPVIFCRDTKNHVRVFLNTCRHRGAVVAREPEGNARSYTCFYHGWSYNLDGELDGVPGADAYPKSFNRAEYGLAGVPRVDSYRGFVFLNFDKNAVTLLEYLGKAIEYIDLVLDQSPSGQMEVIQGTQDYEMRANWKLLVENSFDDYHLLTTHSTWLNYLKNAGVEMKRPERGQLLPSHGKGIDLGNGHATTDNVNFRGRPVAKWIPVYGEAAKAGIERTREELVTRLGDARAARVADTNRNLIIFPNLLIADGSSVTIRTFHPIGPERMRVTAWAVGPKEESPEARAIRLDAFLTFYGPGGFATPDDVEALEMVQRGICSTWREVPYSVMSRGMAKQGEQLNTDELHLRAFWVHWAKLMQDGQHGE
ncbi:MAG: aromatic ring-hydroxylating dioxygenase subunit alpha [Betaproteobacteria bacterium]|nr:aromatic ring-hydroxylating dioxygenase subunit alpha [Betaproteobacteria bacterium]